MFSELFMAAIDNAVNTVSNALEPEDSLEGVVVHHIVSVEMIEGIPCVDIFTFEHGEDRDDEIRDIIVSFCNKANLEAPTAIALEDFVEDYNTRCAPSIGCHLTIATETII